MSLYYPPLNWPQTYEIWSSHIDVANEAGVVADKGELTSLANEIFYAQARPGSGPVWNGRQIRNAFQSALALAAFHTEKGAQIELRRNYFVNVFTVSDNFSRYIWTTQNRQDDAERNRGSMVRRDDYVYDGSGVLNLQPPQQSTAGLQPVYAPGGIQSTPSPFGHSNQPQMGSLSGGGQPYPGDPRNLQTGIQGPPVVPLGQPSILQLQEPSPQLTLPAQLNMPSNNGLKDNYTLQHLLQQQQQQQKLSNPQLTVQPQISVSRNNSIADNYTLQQLQQQQLQQWQQQQQQQHIPRSEVQASQNPTTTPESGLPSLGQNFNHPSPNMP